MVWDEAKADTSEAEMEESVGDMSIIQRAEMLRREVEERFLSQQKRMEVKQQVASDLESLASSKPDRLAAASTGSAAFSRSKQAMAMAAEFCAPSPAWKSGLDSWGVGGGGDEAADGELVDVSLDSLTGAGSEWQKDSIWRESGAASRHPRAYASVIRPDLAEASAMWPDKDNLEAADGMTTTARLDDEERSTRLAVKQSAQLRADAQRQMTRVDEMLSKSPIKAGVAPSRSSLKSAAVRQTSLSRAKGAAGVKEAGGFDPLRVGSGVDGYSGFGTASSFAGEGGEGDGGGMEKVIRSYGERLVAADAEVERAERERVHVEAEAAMKATMGAGARSSSVDTARRAVTSAHSHNHQHQQHAAHKWSPIRSHESQTRRPPLSSRPASARASPSHVSFSTSASTSRPRTAGARVSLNMGGSSSRQVMGLKEEILGGGVHGSSNVEELRALCIKERHATEEASRRAERAAEMARESMMEAQGASREAKEHATRAERAYRLIEGIVRGAQQRSSTGYGRSSATLDKASSSGNKTPPRVKLNASPSPGARMAAYPSPRIKMNASPSPRLAELATPPLRGDAILAAAAAAAAAAAPRSVGGSKGGGKGGRAKAGKNTKGKASRMPFSSKLSVNELPLEAQHAPSVASSKVGLDRGGEPGRDKGGARGVSVDELARQRVERERQISEIRVMLSGMGEE